MEDILNGFDIISKDVRKNEMAVSDKKDYRFILKKKKIGFRSYNDKNIPFTTGLRCIVSEKKGLPNNEITKELLGHKLIPELNKIT